MSEHAAVPALVDPAVSGITRLSATDTVRARIALAIELGLLAHREQLPSDAEVAAALDVSEITARRALKSLADDGVLERRRGRTGGTFVAARADASAVDAMTTYRADAAEVHRLIDRRALFECALVQRAALTATDATLDELDEHVRAGARAQSWADYHAADEKFHRGVAAASGLAWALPEYDEVLSKLYRYFIPYPVDYLHGANEEHAALVAALRKRDAASAVAIIEHHVRVLHETMFVGLRDSVGTSDA
ncbi:MAG TPA: GntR family transcriptional regulator [Microbacteriaceae bacterium]